MTYLVTDNCIKCKHTDCVSVCPVDCFYEADNFLAIDPDQCIDCGVCVPECPTNAIFADVSLEPKEAAVWEEINREVASWGINITTMKDAPSDANDWDGYPNKYEEFGIIPLKAVE